MYLLLEIIYNSAISKHHTFIWGPLVIEVLDAACSSPTEIFMRHTLYCNIHTYACRGLFQLVEAMSKFSTCHLIFIVYNDRFIFQKCKNINTRKRNLDVLQFMKNCSVTFSHYVYSLYKKHHIHHQLT